MDKIIVEQVLAYSDEVCDGVRGLTAQLGDDYTPLSPDDLRRMIASSGNFLFIAKDRHTKAIVGMITLIVYRIPFVKKAMIEDLVVDVNWRRHGIGTLLFTTAISTAKKEQVSYIDFTSRPHRVHANTFYGNLGFKKRDTNVYRLKLDDES